MSRMIKFLFGSTPRERFGSVVGYALTAVVAILAVELKWASKSPTPREWNFYSASANDHLYESATVVAPPLMPVVAHAAGTIPGDPEAGMIKRLDYNYAAGLRLFELDFSWTADEEIVVKHDWKTYSQIPTLAEYLAESPEHASLEMVYDWMEKHPDAFIVLDCKKRSLEQFAKIRMERPSLVPRIIPQIYQLKDYDLAKSQGYRHIILTLYRCLSDTPDAEIVDFAFHHPLFALTIPQSRCEEGNLPFKLKGMGIPVFAHTINDQATATSLVEAGCYGVYSDNLQPNDLVRIAAEPDRTTTR